MSLEWQVIWLTSSIFHTCVYIVHAFIDSFIENGLLTEISFYLCIYTHFHSKFLAKRIARKTLINN